jgi:hypothetical protein
MTPLNTRAPRTPLDVLRMKEMPYYRNLAAAVYHSALKDTHSLVHAGPPTLLLEPPKKVRKESSYAYRARLRKWPMGRRNRLISWAYLESTRVREIATLSAFLADRDTLWGDILASTSSR